MVKLLVHWLLSAVCLLIVARVVPGIFITGLGTALIAAVVVGLVNGTLGALLKLITFPLSVLTFGIFWLVINALMREGFWIQPDSRGSHCITEWTGDNC